MTFDKDFFLMHGAPNFISASAGGPSQPFPGQAGDGTYYHAGWGGFIPRSNVFTWHFPRAASLDQLVVCQWPFGTNDGNEGTSMVMTILDGINQVFASKTGTLSWTAGQRVADRGYVWDIDQVVLKGATITISFIQYKGPNQNNNGFTVGITGSWLREDI